MSGIKAHSRVFGPLAGLLVLAIASFLQIARNAPAFSQELRTESVIGDWRVQVQSALYDKSDYSFQLGVGFLRGNIADALMGEDEAAPQHVFLARVERATQLFEGSLETKPGNAATWTNLAWAHALLGNEEGARSALDHSWNLAPFNNGQAFERMILAISLDKASEPQAPQAATSSIGFQNDREVLRTYDAGRHENLVRQHSDMME